MNQFKRIFALLLLVMGLIVANAAEAVKAVKLNHDRMYGVDKYNGTTALQLTSSPGCGPSLCDLNDPYIQTGYWQIGSTFYKNRLAVSKFATHFTFRINGMGGYQLGYGGDGFAFVIQSVSPSALGAGGPALGYGGQIESGISVGGIPNSIAVEFDTYQNKSFNDPQFPHVALDIEGDTVHNGLPVVEILSPSFNNGNIWDAWIDYDGTTLEVRLSQTNTRPIEAIIKTRINIPKIINRRTAFIGFSGATGGYWQNQNILSWEYKSIYR